MNHGSEKPIFKSLIQPIFKGVLLRNINLTKYEQYTAIIY